LVNLSVFLVNRGVGVTGSLVKFAGGFVFSVLHDLGINLV